ncbi:hypothetical protein V2W30_22500 [Streptomyces sp. Q6]|uniref:Uncharacterized protein n=1 Tax=Streptomyces citrinus TaxID=3118173 RepID=A0ACD5AFC5_9ACTN
MTDIIADQRSEFIAGLRALADFLEQTPSVRCSSTETLLLNLRTTSAVEEFARQLELPVRYDDEGNATSILRFGPIAYEAFGYVDFDQHLAVKSERDARRWAEQHGLEMRPAAEKLAEFRPVVPLSKAPVAQAPAGAAAVTA